jgi:hypothetical protein
VAENHFLEVLLTRFDLKRQERGTELRVEFDGETPAIWLRQAKRQVRAGIPDFSAKASLYQGELDAFLLRGKGSEYRFNDDEFPFRYVSGGTLPVIRMGEREYYCLIYREVDPIGWNIANGGSDSRQELLHPFDAVERELREELFIVDPSVRCNSKSCAVESVHGHRYVFQEEGREPAANPSFEVARKLWRERFAELGFPELVDLKVPLKWLDGPDRLSVRFGSGESVPTEGCFLNINASDFGIEVDRIAKMNVSEDAIFCDGELLPAGMVNQVVGLFEVGRVDRGVAADADEFLPDLVFWDGLKFPGGELPDVIARCLARLRPLIGSEEWEEWQGAESKYDLCPVTKRIIKRYLVLDAEGAGGVSEEAGSSGRACDIFISFGMEDLSLAKRVYAFLRDRTRQRVFFSDETKHHAEYGRDIDNALDAARSLVVVAQDLNHLAKKWVEYEWRTFHQDILSSLKPNGTLVSFIHGIEPLQLPTALRFRDAIVCDDPGDPDPALERLLALIR